MVQGVTEDRFGIGYSGIGYKTSGVKAVALAGEGRRSVLDGSYEDVVSGQVPACAASSTSTSTARPGKPLDPLVREFLKFVFSKEGQEIVVKDGYLPALGRGRQGGAGQAAVAGRARQGRLTPPLPR